jgi:hypothetical protein
MAVGWGNPKDNSNSTASRPAHVNTGAAARRWFQNGTVISPEDLNSVLAAIRHTADTYGIADVEGDDTYLTDAIAAAIAATAPDAGFITDTNAALALRVRVDAAQSFTSGQLTQGRANLALGALAILNTVGASQITDASVTNAKLATMASATIKGRQTGTTGAAQDLTVAQVKTLLALTSADFTDLGDLATADQVTTSLIADGAVTLAKMASLAAATVIGRVGGSGTGVPVALTGAQLTTILALTTDDVAGLDAALAAKAGLASPAFTGTVTVNGTALGALALKSTTAAGDYGTNSIVTTDISTGAITTARLADDAVNSAKILAGAVTMAKLADVATATLIGRSVSGTGSPAALSVATVKTMLAIAAADVSGLGALATLSDVSNAQVAVSAGIVLSKLAAIADQRLIGNTSGGSAVPTTQTPGQVKTMLAIAAGDVSGLGGLAVKTTIVNADVAAGAAITLAKLQDVAAYQLVGNNTGSTGPVTALSAALVKTMLAISAADVSGLGALATKTTIANADVASGAAIAITKLAAIPDLRILGNVAGSSATPASLTATQVKTMLAIAVADVSGLGTSAVVNIGTSGATIPLLNGANIHSGASTFSDQLSATRLIIGPQTALAISGGVATVTSSYSKLSSEGSAATDDLDTLNGGVDGMLLVLSTGFNTQDITVTEAGNFRLNGGPMLLDNVFDTLTCISINGNWLELARASNVP